MRLECPLCEVAILKHDLDFRRQSAFCGVCGTYFCLKDFLAKARKAEPQPKPVPSKPPSDVKVIGKEDELMVQWGELHWTAVFVLLPLCALVDGGLLVTCWNLARQLLAGEGIEWFGVAPIMLVFVALAFGLTYLTLVMLFNSTTVELRCGVLSVRRGPIPLGGHSMEGKDIEQLFLWESDGGDSDGPPVHMLVALLRGGEVVQLLIGDAELLLWLEATLERKLKIYDRRVPGEAEW